MLTGHADLGAAVPAWNTVVSPETTTGGSVAGTKEASPERSWAVPSDAVPSDAASSGAGPSDAVPGGAVPSDAVPATQRTIRGPSPGRVPEPPAGMARYRANSAT